MAVKKPFISKGNGQKRLRHKNSYSSSIGRIFIAYIYTRTGLKINDNMSYGVMNPN